MRALSPGFQSTLLQVIDTVTIKHLKEPDIMAIEDTLDKFKILKGSML